MASTRMFHAPDTAEPTGEDLLRRGQGYIDGSSETLGQGGHGGTVGVRPW